MSRQIRHSRWYRPLPSTCAVALAAAVMATTPMSANAHDTKPMPAGQMDHSKMDGMSMTGDTDYDFAANMRMHHEKGIDMARAELEKGKNPQMIQMAKDIIAAQEKEVAVLDQWLQAHKKTTN